jgi:hypothetical protein
MSRIIGCRRTTWVFAAAILAAAGITYAAIPDAGGVIHACYSKAQPSYVARARRSAEGAPGFQSTPLQGLRIRS